MYCALEGEAGLQSRIAAWEKANGRTLPNSLRLVLQPFRLVAPQDVIDLATAVKIFGDCGVVILDTLNRAAPNADENASADMGRILEGAKELQRLTGGLVILVHHTGKDAERGLRGHSSLLAALDATLEVTRKGDHRDWKVAKAKDGQDGAVRSFRLDIVRLDEDDEGETVTSCVVVPAESPHESSPTPAAKGCNQMKTLDRLRSLLGNSGEYGQAGARFDQRCLRIKDAIDSIAPHLACEPKRQKERVRHALERLISTGVVVHRGDWLWLP